jgi:ATP-dependent Lhr-like helicase
MVYEARPGQVFLLGASSWRIEEITRDRVVVTPAPGVPGAVPFWKGDSVGRPRELGEAIGAFSRWAVEQDAADARRRLRPRPARGAEPARLPARAAGGHAAWSRATGRSSIERFRDEIGDWRLCVLSPYGGRVHAAWGLALSARIREEYGLESDAIWSDDGIIVHLPDADEPPGAELVLLDPDELEDAVVGELGGSALFGARFRENAGRALLIPRAYPGRRTPLWQQRLKSQTLLEVAKRYGQFPIVLETYRECLRDVLDVPGLQDLLRKLHSRELSVVEVETPTASPFASSLLFDYVATYMYESDQPNAERRAAALALDRELLRELLGQEELRDLLDPGALETVEADLQRTSERTRADSVDALHDVLRRVGDLTAEELRVRAVRGADVQAGSSSWRESAGRSGCASAASNAGSPPRTPGLYRDALGAVPPGGLPGRLPADVPDAMERPRAGAGRARHGPFEGRLPTRPLRARPDAGAGRARAQRRAWCAASCARTGTEREWCDPEVLRRLRRPRSRRCGGDRAGRPARTGPLPAQLAGSGPASADGRRDRPACARCSWPLQGLALAAEVWERDVLPRRTGAYSAAWLDELCASGEVVWVGAGPLGRRGGKVALYFREDAAVLGPPAGARGDSAETFAERAHSAVRARLHQGACFFTDLLVDVAGVPSEELQEALWDLVWAGEVTNDAFAPLRSPRGSVPWGQPARAERARRRRFGTRRAGAQPQIQGRWSLTAPLFAPGAADPAGRRRAQAEILLERYGIVTREQVLAEGIPGGFSSLYDSLAALETIGVCQRGYFVEGLGGAQFALPGAAERLRAQRDDDAAPPVVLAATDPAQPYGGVLKWPPRDARSPSRQAGAHVVLAGAEPVLYVERGGKGLQVLVEEGDRRLLVAIEALAAAVGKGRIRRLAVEKVNGEPVVGSEWEEPLLELGFRAGPRKLTIGA